MNFDLLLRELEKDFSDISFKKGEEFSWSPSVKQIVYKKNIEEEKAKWSLLHELSHGVLKHNNYKNDFELIKLEMEAWEKATALAESYGITIDQEHIQDCMDTYRDWLYKRSTCPRCESSSFQHSTNSYKCFNCKKIWKVSNSRFCRTYRLTKI